MNKHYKVIWSKVKNGYVVVSELAKNNGKTTSQSKVGRNIGVALSVLALCVGMSGVAYAADTATGTGSGVAYGTSSEATATTNTAVGPSAKATGTETMAIGNGATASSGYATAIGRAASATGQFSMAIGGGASASNTLSLAIGEDAKAPGVVAMAIGYDTHGNGVGAISLGSYGNTAAAKATSIGFKTKALSNSAIAVGSEVEIDNASNYAILLGGSSDTNKAQIANSKQAIGLGAGVAVANSETAIVLGSLASATDSGNSVVIGGSTSSKSVETVVIGSKTKIEDKAASSIAIGNSAYIGELVPVDPGTKPSDTSNPGYRNRYTSEVIMTNPLEKSKYYFSTAIGTDAKAFGYQNTAFGAGAEAHDTNSTALGFIAVAKGDFSAAIGRNTTTHGKYATALGFVADATGEATLALGSKSGANIAEGVALGSYSKTNVDRDVLGYDPSGKITSQDTLLGDNKATFTELQSEITDAQNAVDSLTSELIALQTEKNTATDERSTEIDAEITEKTTALDAAEDALQDKITAANQLVATWQATAAGVSVGDSKTGLTRQINNVAAGTLDTDAVNVAQLKALSTKVDDNKISFFSVNPEGFEVTSNEDNKGATGYHAMAIGIDASATGLQDIAIGKGALASEGSGVSIGLNSKATGGMATAIGEGTKATMPSTVALGTAAEATQTLAVAIGGAAKSQHYNTIAIGAYANATNISSIAIGQLASTSEMADNGVSIGRETRNTVPNGIALGSYSVADRRENILSYDPLTETNFNFTPEMQTALDAWNAAAAVYYQNPTPENAQASKDAGMKYRLMVAPWMAGMGSLSLGEGETGLTRQITNVAAGTIDTDAVNIAQLKAAKVEVLAGTNISSIDKDTSAGYTQYKVNAKDTITDSATLSGDTITFTRNDGTTYKVSGLASTSALDTNKTRYFSVKSTDAGNRNNDGATGANALAAGVRAKATNTADTAIGYNASASGSWGIAAGAGSKSTGALGIAVGYGANAAANQAIAIGYAATVTKADSLAIGRETQANEANAMAIGLEAKANGNQSMALGYGALTESTANNGIAMGVDAYVGAIRSTDPVQGIPGNSTSIVDDDTTVAPEKAQMNSVAIGNSAKAFGYQTTALGAGAEAHDTNSLAVGIMAIGKGNYATALGKQAYANGNEATALGHWARAYGDNAIAIGSYAITNTLDGTGTVNNGIAIGQKARVASNNSVALGQNSLAYIPDSVKTEAYLTNEAFAAENGVVSVGNAEYTIGDDTVAANRRRITNVAGGADDYDAVNVAQLKALSSKLTQEATDSKLSSGKNITINTTTDDKGVKTNTIDLNDKITLNNEAAPGQQVVVDGTTSNITAGTGDNQVVVNGSNGQVTIGAEGSQLIIGKQGDTEKDKDGNLINPDKTGHYITGLDNTTWKPEKNGIVENRAATEGQLRDAVNNIGTQIGDINTDIEAIQNAKREFISDTGEKIEVGNAETLSITGGAMEPLTDGNIGVVNDGTKGFKVKLSSKLSGLERVTVGSGDTATVIGSDSVTTTELVAGNTTVNTDGVTIKATDSAKSDIKLTSDTISMGKNQIHDVAAGEAETDAVNVGQLNSAVTNIGSNMNYLGNQINKLDNRVNRVGAGAAALAALHPLDYNPTTRWEFAAGVGNYKGANAVAVGAFYRPHSDMMFSLGSSFGGGENMVNAGVTWRVGAGQTTNYVSSQAMAQEIDSLRSVVNDQQSMIQSQNQKLDTQSAQLEEQKQRIEELTQLVNSLVNK